MAHMAPHDVHHLVERVVPLGWACPKSPIRLVEGGGAEGWPILVASGHALAEEPGLEAVQGLPDERTLEPALRPQEVPILASRERRHIIAKHMAKAPVGNRWRCTLCSIKRTAADFIVVQVLGEWCREGALVGHAGIWRMALTNRAHEVAKRLVGVLETVRGRVSNMRSVRPRRMCLSIADAAHIARREVVFSRDQDRAPYLGARKGVFLTAHEGRHHHTGSVQSTTAATRREGRSRAASQTSSRSTARKGTKGGGKSAENKGKRRGGEQSV